MQSYAPDTTSVGVIGTIACGPLAMEEEAVEQYVDLPTSLFGNGDFFILHASGDSMIGAGIDDGDLVLIRKQEEAHNGEIVVAYIEGEGNTLKRFRRYPILNPCRHSHNTSSNLSRASRRILCGQAVLIRWKPSPALPKIAPLSSQRFAFCMIMSSSSAVVIPVPLKSSQIR